MAVKRMLAEACAETDGPFVLAQSHCGPVADRMGLAGVYAFFLRTANTLGGETWDAYAGRLSRRSVRRQGGATKLFAHMDWEFCERTDSHGLSRPASLGLEITRWLPYERYEMLIHNVGYALLTARALLQGAQSLRVHQDTFIGACDLNPLVLQPLGYTRKYDSPWAVLQRQNLKIQSDSDGLPDQGDIRAYVHQAILAVMPHVCISVAEKTNAAARTNPSWLLHQVEDCHT